MAIACFGKVLAYLCPFFPGQHSQGSETKLIHVIENACSDYWSYPTLYLLQVILATLGTLTFATVEWKHYKKPVAGDKLK